VAITCNGVAATFTNPTFSCTPIVPAGTSTITVRATDAASNSRTITIEVSSSDVAVTTPPMTLYLTPQQVTRVSGQTRRFSVMDNLGRVPSDARWTIDNPNAATLSTTPMVTLTGVTAGDVTLTASWQGLTATTHVTVLGAGVQVPVEMTLWATPIHQR
jgi:Bacterial Ig-like domain (group 2)